MLPIYTAADFIWLLKRDLSAGACLFVDTCDVWPLITPVRIAIFNN